MRSTPRPDGRTRPDAGGGRDDVGVILGTAAYMSPEQARGQAVDKRTDIWAFGCVLYEMLTGRVAFAGDTVSDTIAKILEREPDWSALPAGDTSVHSTAPAPLPREGSEAAPERHRRRQDRDRRDRRGAAGRRPKRRRRLRLPPRLARAWLPWVALAALAAGVGVWEARRPVTTPENPLANAQFSRFTDWEGTEEGAEISPDGSSWPFSPTATGEFDLWLSQVGTGRVSESHGGHPTAGGPQSPRTKLGFSGDGAEIWFSPAGDRVRPRKMLMPLTGGTPRAFLGEGDNTPAWSPDGTRLVYFNERHPTITASRRSAWCDRRPHRRRRAPGSSRRRTEAQQQSGVVTGRPVDLLRARIVRAQNWTDEMDVWRVRPSGGSPERLTHQHAP